MHFDITTAIGMLAGVFYLASHFMKDMVPLRVLALASNVTLPDLQYAAHALRHHAVDRVA